MINKKDQIITERLVLKSLEDCDEKETISILENPLVSKTYMSPVFHNDEERKSFFKRLKDISKNNDRIVYGIYLNKSIIGFINDVYIKDDTIELGYLISPKEWNRGYATEALKAVINSLFEIGFKTIECGHFECNPASGKVMQKSGMKKVEKTEVVEYQGIKHNCIFYQITK